jgi:hypothetical protein
MGGRFSPNEEARFLEEAIGIEFPEYPVKLVTDNWRNRFGYSFAVGFRKNDVFSFIASMQKIKNRVGFYDPYYNVAICRNSDDAFTSYHENTHGLTDTINPDFVQVRDNLEESVVAAIRSLNVPEVDVERYVVQRCFSEGVAH